MKVGLVHGRFQPFHNGHEFLVDKMLKDCDIGVILIGSVGKKDKNNLFNLDERIEMIKSIYGFNKNLFIGSNIDLDYPYSKDAQWDVVLASCVLSLTGHLPTYVYSGIDYGVVWKRANVKIKKYDRIEKISGKYVRKLVAERDYEKLKTLVPKSVFEKYLSTI